MCWGRGLRGVGAGPAPGRGLRSTWKARGSGVSGACMSTCGHLSCEDTAGPGPPGTRLLVCMHVRACVVCVCVLCVHTRVHRRLWVWSWPETSQTPSSRLPRGRGGGRGPAWRPVPGPQRRCSGLPGCRRQRPRPPRPARRSAREGPPLRALRGPSPQALGGPLGRGRDPSAQAAGRASEQNIRRWTWD